METKNLIMTIVGVAISVIIVAACLMPILSDAVQTHDTYVNGEYYITMDKIDATSEIRTIEWTKANNTKIVVDGVEMEPAWESISIVATETDLVRCTKQSGAYFVNLVGASNPNGMGSPNYDYVTITIENGTISFKGAIGTTEYTDDVTFTNAYCINPSNDGDYSYIMKTPNAKAYVLGDSEIYGMGFSIFGGAWQNIFSISGTINDGITVNLVSTTLDTDPVISNEQTVYETISDHKGLYKFEKETFTASYGGSDYNLTYSYVIVPAEVTAERTVHFSPGEIAIFSVIPLMIIIAILIMAVSIINRNRE